jgi:hypothetical protein
MPFEKDDFVTFLFPGTLRFHGGSSQVYREYIDMLLEKRIQGLLLEKSHTQERYDEWHQALCEEMASYYKKRNTKFNIGHGQK